ncbi:sporulation peptidase YabG [Paenibacillus sp. F411]|uniref:sporulation peptidase YabG n=1 Tax=unclassified Paenibacillus TaxID=185978 RepID=UPI001AAF1E02|nr:sporulation peptidase YabG [Paenibacillus sp. F411]MBO2945935.1 sporulation peptidase YabG [Paenibacillus sp. F411]
MNLGDLVVRRSYGGDVTFRIESVRPNAAVIKGTDFRLLADAPLSDLVPAARPAVSERTKQAQIKAKESLTRLKLDCARRLDGLRDEWGSSSDKGYFDVPGRVLHLDGDPMYLKKSLALYQQLRVPAEGHYVHESSMADALHRLLPRVRPDIVVITGHDGVLKRPQPYDLYSLDSYKNSHHFVRAIETARQYERNLDALIVIAGACQSHFEAMLQTGANFASSPGRVLIHALDPVYVACKAAYTSVRETMNMNDVLHNTISGTQGLGGIETRGSHRIGSPRLQDLSTLKVTPSIS